MESRKNSIWVQMRGRNCVSTINALMMELQECGIEMYGEKFWGIASIQSKALWSLCRYSVALTHMDGWTEKWKQATRKAFLYRPQLWFFGFWGWSLFAHCSEALLTQVCTVIPRHSRFSLHKKEPGYVWSSSNLNSVWWIVSTFVQSLLLVIVGSSRCLWILI